MVRPTLPMFVDEKGIRMTRKDRVVPGYAPDAKNSKICPGRNDNHNIPPSIGTCRSSKPANKRRSRGLPCCPRSFGHFVLSTLNAYILIIPLPNVLFDDIIGI